MITFYFTKMWGDEKSLCGWPTGANLEDRNSKPWGNLSLSNRKNAGKLYSLLAMY
jgi:hypothetical protein